MMMSRPGATSPPRIAAALSAAMCFSAILVAAAAVATPPSDDGALADIIELPPSPQRPGDPAAGRDYLLYGDYIGSGIPLPLYRAMIAGQPTATPAIERTGLAAGLDHAFNAFTTPDGVDVAATVNCLGCHASMFHGELVIGMGNSLADWSGPGYDTDAVRALARLFYHEGSKEMRALNQFLRGAGAMRGLTSAPFRGVNPAFRLEEIAAAHRNPGDLSWTDEPGYPIRPSLVASDVPPWWNVRKKHALYYTGLGRGDFASGLQQITVVAIEDKADAERISAHMPDLLAYVMSIEPPAFPGTIDAELAARGAEVFAAECAGCHGTYHADPARETYPGKLVPTHKVGTDPLYAASLRESGLWKWYNASWYAKQGGGSYAEPLLAYVAPPLDGIWASAPYLHNGSIPTLDTLLESRARPAFWRRSFRDDDYSLDRVGWNHDVVDRPIDDKTYDTTLPGYGNQGHTYADDLSEPDRRALLEYLKSL